MFIVFLKMHKNNNNGIIDKFQSHTQIFTNASITDLRVGSAIVSGNNENPTKTIKQMFNILRKSLSYNIKL